MKDSLEPQQDRAVRTQQTLLDALERLLETQSFDELTVAKIAAEAGLTTGAIYRRFKDKRALLQSAFERFVEQSRELQPARLEAIVEMNDAEKIAYMIRSTLKFTIPYIPVMRAASALNDDESFKHMLDARNMSADWLAARLTSSRLDEKELQQRMRFTMRTITAVIRDTLMAGTGSPETKTKGKAANRMVQELTEMSIRYLELENGSSI